MKLGGDYPNHHSTPFRRGPQCFPDFLCFVKSKTNLVDPHGMNLLFPFEKAQQKVVAQRHNIDGRWCDVRIPNSKGGDSEVSKKIFVGRVSEELNKQDLKDYFSQFGEVCKTFVQRGYRIEVRIRDKRSLSRLLMS